MTKNKNKNELVVLHSSDNEAKALLLGRNDFFVLFSNYFFFLSKTLFVCASKANRQYQREQKITVLPTEQVDMS